MVTLEALETLSAHLLIELHGCAPQLTDDLQALRSLLLEAARRSGATVVAEVFHRYAPQGVSGVVVIEESHLSVHTWPEHGYVAVDFFSCGQIDPYLAAEHLRLGLRAERAELLLVRRGLPGAVGLLAGAVERRP